MEFKEWVQSKSSDIEQVVVAACESYAKSIFKRGKNLLWDINQTTEESYNLVNGHDLFYDRPSTPMTYSLWYQCRRINILLGFVSNQLKENHDDLTFIDLGAGTGSLAFAIGLFHVYSKTIKKVEHNYSIINIDTSPFMLDFARNHLWPKATEKFPEFNKVKVFFEVNSWQNAVLNFNMNRVWLTASYLFDSSDSEKEITESFLDLAEKLKPLRIFIISTPTKMAKTTSLAEGLAKMKYQKRPIQNSEILLSGLNPFINSFRKRLYEKVGNGKLLRGSTWDDKSISGIEYYYPNFGIQFGGSDIKNIELYNQAIKVRTDVRLSKVQLQASEYTGSTLKLIGPAGSGKSIVLTERLKRAVTASNYDPNLRILVSSFNKKLLWKLCEWTSTLLSSEKFAVRAIGDNNQIYFKGSTAPNIEFLHFDILPRKFEIPANIQLEQYHLDLISKEAQAVALLYDPKGQHNAIYDPKFLLTEYQTTIYGTNRRKESEYLEKQRIGRGNFPYVNKTRKKLIFLIIGNYLKKLNKLGVNSFITRRSKLFLKLTKSQGSVQKYDFIFLDEFQDCTPADLFIFRLLLKTQENLFIGGDLAQAVHLGLGSKAIDEMSINLTKWSKDELKTKLIRLEGSFRLPVRIAQALAPLSVHLVNKFEKSGSVTQLEPQKLSIPGPRPVIVWGDTIDSLSVKMCETIISYSAYNLSTICVLEKNYEMSKKVWAQYTNRVLLNPELAISELKSIESDSVLSIKGLEKRCVIWDTSAPIYDNDPARLFEFVYTILTRTTGLLVIAISPATLDYYRQIFNLLDNRYLIYWDDDSQSSFTSLLKTDEPLNEKFDSESLSEDDSILGMEAQTLDD
jgi:DNA helicase-2/ATP-dependent DNA helicase PcrA